MASIDHADRWAEHLATQIIPFWLSHLDTTNGGVFTCLNNVDGMRISGDKLTWSQGRALWLLARTSEAITTGALTHPGLPDTGILSASAAQTAEFLRAHAVRPDGSCYFRLTAEGDPVEDPKSISAEVFCALGLAEYARVARDVAAYETASLVLARVQEQIAAGDPPTAPYTVPLGWRNLGVPMSLLPALDAAAAAAAVVKPSDVEELTRWADDVAGQVVALMDPQTGDVVEFIPPDDASLDTIAARHRTPGHAIEAAWFVLDHHLAGGSASSDVVGTCASVVLHALESGWDPVDGGIFRYVDVDGHTPPTGRQAGHVHADLVISTWDTKLWWPHSEALYATAALEAQDALDAARRDQLAEWHRRVRQYTFDTFPDPHQGSEWIQIRDRAGKPLDKVVALPVKDPFHIWRALLLLVELNRRGTR